MRGVWSLLVTSGAAGLMSGAICLWLQRRSSCHRPSTWKIEQLSVPPGLGPTVWRDYQADRISLVSALLRTEELFAARVAEITDWQTIDWTTSPLEPLKGRWEWDGDRLVEKPPPTPGTLEHVAKTMAGALGVPSHLVGCRCGLAMSADGMCSRCKPMGLPTADEALERFMRTGEPRLLPPPKPSDAARSAIAPAFRTELLP